MLTQEQIELRKSGIGSSDIARIVCFDKWEVWAEKTGKVVDKPYTPAMRRGDALEPVIADLYQERFGVDWLQEGTTRKEGWRLATPDYFVGIADSGGFDILECKAPGYRIGWGEEFTDDIPQHVIIQVQWQLDIELGANKGKVGALIGNDFLVYQVDRERQLCVMLEEIGYNFWHNHVLKDIPPEVDKSDSATRYLHKLYPKNKGVMLNQTDATKNLVRKLGAANETINDFKKVKTQTENQLKEIIGDADGIDDLCTWKADKNGRRILRLIKER
jgi:predicted phage-related endonuclease